jgi:hypothetical protein
MSEPIAKMFFPALYGKLEKKKQAARNAPLSMADINTLLSMQFNNKPLFPSIEDFYSEEYKKALENETAPAELEKLQRFRHPTESELNQLYSDIHVREEPSSSSKAENANPSM